MQKTILVTGSTDGIGLATAKKLVSLGHNVLLHGRNSKKLADVEQALSQLPGEGKVESYVADLSRRSNVQKLIEDINQRHSKLDVLINNAGIFHTPETITEDGLDIRFSVNTLAPYLLTQGLLPLLNAAEENGKSRVVNLSSAAQSPVDLKALMGLGTLSHMAAYSQSKLAITMWSRHMADANKEKGPVIIPVNPGSMLGSKMVKEGFGVSGGDISVGADILIQAALDEKFATASGQYFDNDIGQFSSPHPDAENADKNQELVRVIETLIAEFK